MEANLYQNFFLNFLQSPVYIISLFLPIHPCIIWGMHKGLVRGSHTQKYILSPRPNNNNTELIFIKGTIAHH